MATFALVGAGHHARTAVREAFARHCRRARLVAASDIRREALEAFPELGEHRYADPREMLARERPDAVYVSTLPDSHAAIANDAFRAGCHVLCEKPLAATADECRGMIGAAAEAKRLLSVVFEMRYDPGCRRVRDWIRSGALGEVEAIHIQHMWDGHKSIGELAERRARLIRASGALDHGIHRLDIARYWLGGGDWTEIRAIGAWLGEAFAYPPHISVLARLGRRVLVTLDVSLSYTAHIPRRAASHGLSIVGTKGVVELRPEGLRLVCEAREEVFAEGARIREVETMASLIDDFAEAVERGGVPSPDLPTGADGLSAQIAIEEANRQAAAGRPRSDGEQPEGGMGG